MLVCVGETPYLLLSRTILICGCKKRSVRNVAGALLYYLDSNAIHPLLRDSSAQISNLKISSALFSLKQARAAARRAANAAVGADGGGRARASSSERLGLVKESSGGDAEYGGTGSGR